MPKWLLQKKYRGSIKQRLGLKLPKASDKESIWIHMVSMGETKAMIPIFERLKEKDPNIPIYLSSTTKTGHMEAIRCMKEATDYFYLPLDFSWTMKILIKRLKPKLLILSEGDFWPNMLKTVKGKVVVLNGKISTRSLGRFQKFPKFSKPLFQSIDHFCVQTGEYEKRFEALGISKENLSIAGNLKLSITPNPNTQSFIETYNLNPSDQFVTIASTHEREEELLLNNGALQNYTILLAPRHPERFEKVKKIASKHSNVILIAEMGALASCYALSQFAIVGGSFIPGVGGHNIFEPIQAKIPVFFGPYMETQKELTELVLNSEAGVQSTPENLKKFIENLSTYRKNASILSTTGTEILEKNWELLETFLS